VRYHNAGIPTSIDDDKHVIKIGGNAAGKPYELTMADLRTQFKPDEMVAVNQCSGNSRGFFNPRVTGGQLANGAMGNARWVGVPLRDVLARAELKNTAREVTFNGLDIALFGGGDFVKSSSQPRDGRRGDAGLPDERRRYPAAQRLPGRLIVPGYYGTYWVGLNCRKSRSSTRHSRASG
jgi:DMSO/TMAO reductase YedYZ molybdopterin-dependent catalytic subunit